MKSKLIVITIALMLSLTACGTTQQPQTTKDTTATSTSVSATGETEIEATEEPTEKPTQESTEEPTKEPTETPKEDLKDFSVSTSESLKGIDDKLVEIVENKGIEVTRTEENISFSATETLMKDIATEYKNKLEKMAQENSSNENDLIDSISIADDFSSIDFYVKDGFENSMGALGLLFYVQPMGELQMLTGVKQQEIQYTQKIINVNTNEVISEAVIPDDLNTKE